MQKKSAFKKKMFSKIFAAVSPILLTAAVVLMIMYGLNETERSSASEGRRILEQSVRRAMVKCYAVEGSYPDTISYIEKNYIIHIDKSKYYVDYEVFASNVLPSVNVTELEPIERNSRRR